MNAATRADASDLAPIGDDAFDGRAAADFDAQIVAGLFEGSRETSHAALDVAPDAARAAGFAHDVMQEHIRGARI